MTDLARWRDLSRLARGYRRPILGAAVLSLLGTLLRAGETNMRLAQSKLQTLDRLPVYVLGAVLNGIQAMPRGGTLIVRARREERLHLRDRGVEAALGIDQQLPRAVLLGVADPSQELAVHPAARLHGR